MLLGSEQFRFAYSVIVHPQYNDETFENNIGLIQVSPPFNMTDPGISKICLPSSTTEDYPPINSTVNENFMLLTCVFNHTFISSLLQLVGDYYQRMAPTLQHFNK